jgi:hypothetical protein
MVQVVSQNGDPKGVFQSLNGNILGEHEDQWINQLNGFLVSVFDTTLQNCWVPVSF